MSMSDGFDGATRRDRPREANGEGAVPRRLKQNDVAVGPEPDSKPAKIFRLEMARLFGSTISVDGRA